MAAIRLTKEFSFEMAHTLAGYDGPCREIHGHSYKLFVTVKGEPVADAAEPKYGMVMDFGELKRIVGRLIVDRYDHALVMRATADNGELIRTLRGNYAKIEVVARFAAAIEKELPAGVELFSIRLHETATSFAEWFRSDNR